MTDDLAQKVELVSGDEYDAMIVLNGHKSPDEIKCPISHSVSFDMEPVWSSNRDPKLSTYVGKMWSHIPGTEPHREFGPPPMVTHIYPKPAHHKEIVADSGVSSRAVANTVFEKTKPLSLVVSNINNYERYNFVLRLLQSDLDFDFWGRDWPAGFDRRYKGYVEAKVDSLASYKYSICLENSSYDGYITEKFIDAFLCGTIPIYWGAPDVAKWYGDSFESISLSDPNPAQTIRNIIERNEPKDLDAAKRFYFDMNNPIKKTLEYLESLA
jgi:hypothetical protein